MSDQRPFDPPVSPDWDAIARHLAGEGTEAERVAFEQALATDPEHGRLLESLRSAVRNTEPVAPTSTEVEAALKSVLARRGDAVVGRPAPPKVISLDAHRRTPRAFVLKAAAAVIVVAAAAMLWRSSLVRGGSAATRQQFASAVGALDSLTLVDGTHVLLGPGSQLVLGAGFGTTARELTLTGEARFDVTHDPSRPFTVHTATATFRDVGTVFSIHSDRDEGARIAVLEGSVSVQGVRTEAPVTLGKGDRAAVAPDGAVHVDRSSLAADDTAWAEGKLVFRDAPVPQVVADLRRWYGMDVHVDSALATHRVSAEFDRSAGADVGRVIAAMLGGGFRQEGSTLYIVPPPTAPASR